MASNGRPATNGFTLVEVVAALFVLSLAVIATAPLFVYAARENAVGGDLGTTGALAVDRMELLRAMPYSGLVDGGDLDTDVAGYSDDSHPGFTVRWRIVDNPNPPSPSKIISVRAVADRQVIGRAKQATMMTVRGG